MTLLEAIDSYIAWKRTLGQRFESGAHRLHSFSRFVGQEAHCNAVSVEQVRDFLAGSGPLTPTRSHRYSTLAGFFNYAVGRGLAQVAPLPMDEPKPPPYAPAYIYSTDELRRLFDAIEPTRKQARQLDAHTLRAVLLTLYGAGLRLGEALRLTRADVDLPHALLTIHDSKFHKTRFVPLGPALGRHLAAYDSRRRRDQVPANAASAFFTNRDGTPLNIRVVQGAFEAVRNAAGVRRTDGAQRQPCLHDMRHSFAVHRLVSWYRQGADVQQLLPCLSTYLGHSSVASTQVYLQMTPELLREASRRYERYADTGTGADHD